MADGDVSTDTVAGQSFKIVNPVPMVRSAQRRRFAVQLFATFYSRQHQRGREDWGDPTDGFLAMFDGPQRAIRCAMAIRDAVQVLGICPRCGDAQ